MNVEPRPKSGAARKRRRSGGLSNTTAIMVHDRSRGCCEAASEAPCGARGVHPADHIHHVKMRSQGGSNDLSNLLHVCTAAHVWIHANPAVSYELGLLERGVS